MCVFIRPSSDRFGLMNLKGNHQKFSKVEGQTRRTQDNFAKGLLGRDKLSEIYKQPVLQY